MSNNKHCWYSELWIDSDYKQRTTELEDTNNPVWDQQFTFNVPEDNSFHDLYLEVLDKEFIGSDDIGKASIDFRSVYEGDVIDEWVSLPAWLGLASRGEVHIRIEFTPKEEEEAAEAEEE